MTSLCPKVVRFAITEPSPFAKILSTRLIKSTGLINRFDSVASNGFLPPHPALSHSQVVQSSRFFLVGYP